MYVIHDNLKLFIESVNRPPILPACVCAAVGFSVVLHFTAIPKCVLHSWRNVMRYRCVFRVAHKNCTIRLLVKVHTLTHWILGIKLRADESTVPYPCFALLAVCIQVKGRNNEMNELLFTAREYIFRQQRILHQIYQQQTFTHLFSFSYEETFVGIP